MIEVERLTGVCSLACRSSDRAPTPMRGSPGMRRRPALCPCRGFTLAMSVFAPCPLAVRGDSMEAHGLRARIRWNLAASLG
jgi:hypothetical protein